MFWSKNDPFCSCRISHSRIPISNYMNITSPPNTYPLCTCTHPLLSRLWWLVQQWTQHRSQIEFERWDEREGDHETQSCTGHDAVSNGWQSGWWQRMMPPSLVIPCHQVSAEYELIYSPYQFPGVEETWPSPSISSMQLISASIGVMSLSCRPLRTDCSSDIISCQDETICFDGPDGWILIIFCCWRQSDRDSVSLWEEVIFTRPFAVVFRLTLFSCLALKLLLSFMPLISSQSATSSLYSKSGNPT